MSNKSHLQPSFIRINTDIKLVLALHVTRWTGQCWLRQFSGITHDKSTWRRGTTAGTDTCLTCMTSSHLYDVTVDTCLTCMTSSKPREWWRHNGTWLRLFCFQSRSLLR